MRNGNFVELGVLYWHLNPKDYENDEELRKIREARGYNYMVPVLPFKFYFFPLRKKKYYLVVIFNSKSPN